MGDTSIDASRGRQRQMSPWLQVVVVIGLLLAAGTFGFVAFAPDQGATASSLRTGIALGVVVASGPIAIIVRPVSPGRLVSLGGGMTVAGFIASFGGNLSAVPMELLGILVLLVGATQRPLLSVGIVARLVAYFLVLAAALLLALGETIQVVAAVLLALTVATSTIWERLGENETA